MLVVVVSVYEGSPPHTRGIPRPPLRRSTFWGFTPAYAGNTDDGETWEYDYGVHPRIRGEYLT